MPKAIVFVLHNGHVLIGRGGKWLMDVTPESQKDELAKKQRSTAATATEATVEILKNLPAGAMMKPVVARKGYFSSKFIRIDNPNPPGFLKGDTESGESARDAIAREVEEETFTKFPASRFTEVHSNIFKIELNAAEAKAIHKNWETQRKNGIGELVSLGWTAIKDVHTLDLNRESQGALKYLPSSGGRRTRRRMLKKPKTLKKRVG